MRHYLYSLIYCTDQRVAPPLDLYFLVFLFSLLFYGPIEWTQEEGHNSNCKYLGKWEIHQLSDPLFMIVPLFAGHNCSVNFVLLFYDPL